MEFTKKGIDQHYFKIYTIGHNKPILWQNVLNGCALTLNKIYEDMFTFHCYALYYLSPI